MVTYADRLPEAEVLDGQTMMSWLVDQIEDASLLALTHRTWRSESLARSALVAFNASGLPTAWYWQQLVDLVELAGPDRLTVEMLIPRARGTLQMRSREEALEWLAFQRQILDELNRMGAHETAAEHAAAVVDSLPFALIGEEWWPIMMQWLGYAGRPVSDASNRPLTDAFVRAERAYETVGRVAEMAGTRRSS